MGVIKIMVSEKLFIIIEMNIRAANNEPKNILKEIFFLKKNICLLLKIQQNI